MLCSDGEHRREGDKEFGGAAAKGGEALSRRKVAISALARAPLPGGPLAHLPGGPGFGAPARAAGSLLRARQGAARHQWRAPPGPRARPLLLPGPEPGRPRRAGAPELRASAAFPGRQTLTHSCPGGGSSQAGSRRSRPASAPSPEGGVPGRLAGGPARYGEHGPGASPHLASAEPGPGEGGEPVCSPSRSSSRRLLRADRGVRKPGPTAGADTGRPLPGAPGAREGTMGGGAPTRAEGSHVGPRAGWGPGARGSRARPGVSQKSPWLITHSRAAECDRGLLNLPVRDEISPSNLDGLHSIKQK